MSDLVAFLAARLDEDERNAREAQALWADTHFTIDPGSLVIVRFHRQHDPARVLREIKADRVILERYTTAGNETNIGSQLQRHQELAGLDFAIRARAAVYAGHPDYDEAWKP